MSGVVVRRLRRAIIVAIVCVTVMGCWGGPRAKDVRKLPPDQIGRPGLERGEAQSLQSAIMALSDTAIQRIAAGLGLGQSEPTPQARREDMNTRLILASALVGIAMEPDPVDALADLLTHTTLTADAQRVVAKDTPAGSTERRLLRALEQNDSDAWQLAERWVNEPTRIAFRARILDWQGPRTSPAAVAYVRLHDIKRAGATSVESGDGMFASLSAATAQADEARLLAERSLYFAQRMPFLLRWQAEVYTANALATQEAQQTQAQIEQMSVILTETSRVFAGMTAQLSRERQSGLDDLFAHIEAERRATLNQVTQTVQQERKATLAEASATIDAQRKAILKDLIEVTGAAGRTGNMLIGRTLVIGGLLFVVLLAGLLATLLLYRRLLPLVERRAARG
jgi:hypothetical protein